VVVNTESLSQYSFTADERARRIRDFVRNPDLNDPLEGQSEPVEYTMLSDSSPPSFVSNDLVFQIDW